MYLARSSPTVLTWFMDASLSGLQRPHSGTPRPPGASTPSRLQREAIEQAMTTRLCLLWGPPGTGKSATAVAMIVALVANAEARGEPIRIAVTGPTWVAIDNVMGELPAALADAKLQGRASLARLMSPVSP